MTTIFYTRYPQNDPKIINFEISIKYRYFIKIGVIFNIIPYDNNILHQLRALSLYTY
jgi:hypothetical protein